MHAGLSGEAKALPRSLWNDAGPPSNTAAVHAGKLLGAGGTLDPCVVISVPFMALFCSLGVFLLWLCPLLTAISAVMNNSSARSTSSPVSDYWFARDWKGHREGASQSAAAVEGDARRSALQVPSQDARCQGNPNRWAAQTPGPETTAQHQGGVSSRTQARWGAREVQSQDWSKARESHTPTSAGRLALAQTLDLRRVQREHEQYRAWHLPVESAGCTHVNHSRLFGRAFPPSSMIGFNDVLHRLATRGLF